jgi:hypothetical protein
LRRPILPGDGRVILVALMFPLGALALHARAAPAAAPPSPDREPLIRSLVEAHANCDAARDLDEGLAPGGPRVHLETRELRAVLDRVARDPHEQARLLRTVRLVDDLARALAEGPARARAFLAGERLTSEDARFLVAALHARVARAARAAGVELETHGHAFAATRLKQFRGLGLEEGLAKLE